MGADAERSPLFLAILLFGALMLPTLPAGAVDTDGDTVGDASDECPYGSGQSGIASSGCPDSNNNGVADRDEEVAFDFNGRGILATVSGNVSTSTTAWAKDDSSFAVG